MTTRDKMMDFRLKNNKSLSEMSIETGVSTTLLDMIEKGYVTHPKIAEKLGEAYGLTKEETEDLMPENQRSSHPKYDPNKYKAIEDIEPENIKRIKLVATPYSEMDKYMIEKQNIKMEV